MDPKAIVATRKMCAFGVGVKNGVRLSTLSVIQFCEEIESSIEKSLDPSPSRQQQQQQQRQPQQDQQQ